MKIIDQQKLGDYILLTLRGDIWYFDISSLSNHFNKFLQFKHNIIIDFEECERIHSSAIAFFLNMNMELLKNDIRLYLCHPPYDFQFVLQLLDLEYHLHIVKELDDLLTDQDFQNAKSLDTIPIATHSEPEPQQIIQNESSIEVKDEEDDMDDGNEFIPKPTIYHVPNDQ